MHPPTRHAYAPGRVNLIGDHTDYNEGLALPMAIDRGVDATFTETGTTLLHCVSTAYPQPAAIPVDVPLDPRVIRSLEPPWARLAAAVVAQVAPRQGGVVRIDSALPEGAGLSSSAAFCVALALALGFEGDPQTVARMVQRAEAAAGSDVGLMDPLVSMGGVAGHALLIDFATVSYDAVPLPDGLEVVVVHSGVPRRLAHTPYAARRAECDAASLELGRPVGRAEEADVPGILDPLLRRRTRHVVTECSRVRDMAGALAEGDVSRAGRLMGESQRSLAEDFEASTPEVDALVATLGAAPGVYGARMTGGGFGGCVVVLAEAGALDVASLPGHPLAFRLAPSAGATVTTDGPQGRGEAEGEAPGAGPDGATAPPPPPPPRVSTRA